MEPGNLSANSVLVDKVAAMAKEKGAAQCNVVAALVPKEEVHGNRYAGNDTKRGTYLCNGQRKGSCTIQFELGAIARNRCLSYSWHDFNCTFIR